MSISTLLTAVVSTTASCNVMAPGINVAYDASSGTTSSAYSETLPLLPAGTAAVSYGPPSLCTSTESFDGMVVVGAPLSVSPSDSYFAYSKMIKGSVEIFLDWLLTERTPRGLQVGDQRFSMRFEWVGDASSKTQVTPALAVATRGNGAHFAMGGYSSALTQYAAQQSFADGLLMVSAGAASTSVFTQNNLTFGLYPPAAVYHDNPLAAIAAAAADVDANQPPASAATDSQSPCFAGGGGCLASLRVGFIQADTLFAKSQCANGEALGAKHGFEVARDGAGVALIVTIPKAPTDTNEVDDALRQLRDAGVNVLVGCTYLSTTKAIIAALERLDWSPLALSVSSSVGTASFAASTRDGWWQAEYALGPSPWHRTVPTVGNFSGMTSADFAARYAARHNEAEVSYHGASAFGGVAALVAAIEAAGTLETEAVAQQLAASSLREFYGDIAFDANGQITVGMLVLQAPDGASSSTHSGDPEMVVWPPEARATANAVLAFPTPPWAQRRCRLFGGGAALGATERAGIRYIEDGRAYIEEIQCSGHGQCDMGGVCVCTGGYRGVDCEDPPEEEDEHLRRVLLTTVLPAAGVIALLALALFLVARRFKLAKRRRQLLWRSTRQPPRLRSKAGGEYHLFLSHTWSSGQDQVHMIKRRLATLAPKMKVFLDVDDLEEFGTLADNVAASDVVLLFLSRGYFASKACQIEYTAACRLGKPVVVVHESNENHGGAPLEELRDQCPDECRAHLFGSRAVVPWLRSEVFQLVTLKKIVAVVLSADGGEAATGKQAGGGDEIASVASDLSTHSRESRVGESSSGGGRRRSLAELQLERATMASAEAARRVAARAMARAPAKKECESADLYLHKELKPAAGLGPGPGLTLLYSRHNPGARLVASQLAATVAGCVAVEAPAGGATSVGGGRVLPLLVLNARTFEGADGEALAREVCGWRAAFKETVCAAERTRQRQEAASGLAKLTNRIEELTGVDVDGDGDVNGKCLERGSLSLSSNVHSGQVSLGEASGRAQPKHGGAVGEASERVRSSSSGSGADSESEEPAGGVEMGRLLLVHMLDPEDDGCRFEQVMAQTPQHLVDDKLYSQIALPWFHTPDYRAAALAVLSHTLVKEGSSAPSSRARGGTRWWASTRSGPVTERRASGQLMFRRRSSAPV